MGEINDPITVFLPLTMVAWTGMRGVVSLAAALALPLTLPNGAVFPGRDFILLFTFSVILATLVLLSGQIFAIFVIVLAAAEAAVALAIFLNFYNNFSTIDVERAQNLKG